VAGCSHDAAVRSAGTVVVVCPGALENGGGIGRQMGYFLNALEETDSTPTYRVVDSRGPWFLGNSVLHRPSAVCYLAAAALRLLAVRLSRTPSIAHINITGRGSTIRKTVLVGLCRTVGLQYLLHVHDANYAEEYRRRGFLMKAAIRSMFRGAATVLVLGARDREQLSSLLHLSRDQVQVLHNAVPDPRPSPRGARRPNNPLHVLFLGHLSERKGVSVLLRALAHPTLSSARWRATLAGDGPVEDYRRLAKSLGIAHRIRFPGWVDQARVSALCNEADVLVLPSHAEGLAMSVLEGLSHGIAVIATPVGAHEEVIEQEVSGLFVPPGDDVALACALRRLIDDGQLSNRLGAGARRQFFRKFHVDIYAERLSRFHARLLAEQLHH
jgi:glycosyltransferase involved in cell wall biosynthesis